MTSVFCVICRDNENTDWVALSCGHVCHQICLTGWFNHNQSCPSCRLPSNGRHIKVYFDNQEREATALLPAAAAVIETQDPLEVQQLCGLLFNENQATEAALKQAFDSTKEVSRLEMRLQETVSEIQWLEEEFANCRNENAEIMQLLEQKEREIIHLNQRLQLEEQQNRELNYALVAHEESSVKSNDDHAWRQLELETELESEKQHRRQQDGVIENLTLMNSQSAEQKRMAEQMARDLNSKLNAVQRKLKETKTVLTTVKENFERDLTQEKHGRQQDVESFRFLVAELQGQNMKLEEKVISVENNNRREFIAERQRNQLLMENYTKLKATADEQKTAIIKAQEQQNTLENDNEELRRLLNVMKTEIARLKSDLTNKEEIASVGLPGIEYIYSEVDSAGIGIFNGGMQYQGRMDDSLPVKPSFASPASSLNDNLESSRQRDTTLISNSRLQEAGERYLYDSFAAPSLPALPLNQLESVYYSHIGNSSEEQTADWNKLPDETSCQNEAASKINQISTDQAMEEGRPHHRDVGLRPKLGTGHCAPATRNPVKETSKRHPLLASTSNLHVPHQMMPPGNMQPTNKYNIPERAKSMTDLKSTDSSVTVKPDKRYQTRTPEPEQEDEKGETALAVKNSKHPTRYGKERSKKDKCRLM